MHVLIGRTLSHYRIVAKIGEGGMGEVYRAEDEHLDGREVALKILPVGVLTDEASRQRFRREALALSKLNHPSIATVHDFDSQEGVDFLVMEYVAGAPLDTKVREGPLPEKEVARLGVELAEGLAVAHRQGIVHRDLKPRNLRLTPDGRLKILDFGLAKLVNPPTGGNASETLTQSASLTHPNIVVGTLPYMSPEQIRGEGVDPRSDLWAAGVVLYELATGRRPFDSNNRAAIEADIQTKAPSSPRRVNSRLSPGLESIILRCLEKDPGHRYQSASDLGADLRRLLASSTVGRRSPPIGLRSLKRLAAIVAGLVLVSVVLALGVGSFRQWLSALPRHLLGSGPSPGAIRRQLTFSGNAVFPSISPDGQFLAYVVPGAERRLVLVQDLSGGAPDTLAIFAGPVHSLEWSRSGTQLLVGFGPSAFVFSRHGGPARRVPIPTGYPLFVRAYWLPDGAHVSVHAASSQNVLIIGLEAGDTTSIPVGGSYTWLEAGSWSPDGQTFAVGTVSDQAHLWSIRTVTRSGHTEVVAEDDSMAIGSPRWSRAGDALFYRRGDAIWRVPVSERTGRRRGEPRLVHDQLAMYGGAFSVSPDGRHMVYARGLQFSNLWILQFRGSGQPPLQTALTKGTSEHWAAAVSPDGRWIGYARQGELFRIPFEGGDESQITFGAHLREGGEIAWSPDGNQLACIRRLRRADEVCVVDVDGGHLRPLEGTDPSNQLAWAPASRIAYQSEGNRNIHLIDPRSGHQVALFPDTVNGWFFAPRYSPDGERLAMIWNRNHPHAYGGIAIADTRGTLIAVYPSRGANPAGWSPDGRDLYLLEGSTIYRLDTRSGSRRSVLAMPWQFVNCASAGPNHANAFLCTVYDHLSDIWMIDNFEAGAP